MDDPQVIEGDCLDVLPPLPKAALVYADPPFWCGRRLSGRAGSFDDTGSLSDYVDRLVPRIVAAWGQVDARGSLVVHLDWHASAYVRVAMDRVLGREDFASEIIWRYRRWPAKTANFQHVHDTLLRYVKTPGNSRWTQLYEPLAPSTVKTWGTGKQKKGTRKDATLGESRGCAMGDVWDIPIVAPVAKERTGYPTQKPEALLERLILALTDPCDLVIDPYCGSGTTLAVARRLGRRSIGIDANPEAINVTKERLWPTQQQ